MDPFVVDLESMSELKLGIKAAQLVAHLFGAKGLPR
jgi:hypothetical protein